MAFADETTSTLLTIRGNLISGLDRVTEHTTAGTLYDVSAKGSSPAQGGWVVLMLLRTVDTELAHRENAQREAAA